MTNPERTSNANQSRRCSHIKVNGLRCHAPARRGDFLCVFHDSAEPRSATDFWIPIVEDHASFQLAVNKVLQAVIDKLIDQKTAHTLLYGLQIAYTNLKPLSTERRIDRIDRYQAAQAEKEAAAEAASAAKQAAILAKQATAKQTTAAEEGTEAAWEGHDFSRANQPVQTNPALAAEAHTNQPEQDFSPAKLAPINLGPAWEGHDFSRADQPAQINPALAAEETNSCRDPKEFSFEQLYANLFPEMPKPPQSVRQIMQEVLKEKSSG